MVALTRPGAALLAAAGAFLVVHGAFALVHTAHGLSRLFARSLLGLLIAGVLYAALRAIPRR